MQTWKEINFLLTQSLGICGCQRKFKSIVQVLVAIWENGYRDEEHPERYMARPWEPAEWLVLAMLDSRDLIEHGINCEYPIIIPNEFWDWVLAVKDNPNLVDN
jgi:hypothetical protein